MLKQIACALTLAVSLPTAAMAAEPLVRSEFVRFDDLNLASPAGNKTLNRRIEAAVRRVCGYSEGRGFSLIVRQEVTTCMTNARDSARSDIALKTGNTNIRKG